MKKFLSIMLLAVTLIFVSGQNQAEARELYVGKYSDGTSVYVLTETVNSIGGGRWSGCKVRAGRNYLDYNFCHNKGNPTYENSEGYKGYCFDGSSPVAAAIYNYILSGDWWKEKKF